MRGVIGERNCGTNSRATLIYNAEESVGNLGSLNIDPFTPFYFASFLMSIHKRFIGWNSIEPIQSMLRKTFRVNGTYRMSYK